MRCSKCDCKLHTEIELDLELCTECAEEDGLLDPECVRCGVILSSDEYEVGMGMCFSCMDDDDNI